MVITSRSNPLVRRILALRDKKVRRTEQEYIVEGVKQVREAAAAGCRFSLLVYAESFTGEKFFPELSQTVSDGVFEKLSEEVTPQGVLAVLKIPAYSVCAPRGNCLLLDGVSDPGNVGTILRTANAAGYEDVYLASCADPFSSKCVRASMSGIFFLRLHIGEREEILRALSGIPLLCADMDGENVFTFRAPDTFCLVIGNEANGVSDQVRQACGHTVKIPMRESCESLNAGVSAGILMYELAAKNHGKQF